MTLNSTEGPPSGLAHNRKALAGSDRRTLDAIFHHPSSHNLKWKNVVALINTIGAVHEDRNSLFVFEVCGSHLRWHRPHGKDLTGSEVLGLRQFLMQSGWSDAIASQAVKHPVPAALDLVVVLDRHETRIFQIDVASDDASREIIRPYDPQHLLHHLFHKDFTRVSDSPEALSFYEKISDIVALGGKILVVGHGAGMGDAAHHLAEYLGSHHRETYRRTVYVKVSDIGDIAIPQIVEIAQDALRG
jgi:hypothetical protein